MGKKKKKRVLLSAPPARRQFDLRAKNTSFAGIPTMRLWMEGGTYSQGKPFGGGGGSPWVGEGTGVLFHNQAGDEWKFASFMLRHLQAEMGRPKNQPF